MLKNILKLDGAQQLSKKEQKEINGGKINCTSKSNNCPAGQCCKVGNYCGPIGGPVLCYAPAPGGELGL
jgi:hypothetical protein